MAETMTSAGSESVPFTENIDFTGNSEDGDMCYIAGNLSHQLVEGTDHTEQDPTSLSHRRHMALPPPLSSTGVHSAATGNI